MYITVKQTSIIVDGYEVGMAPRLERSFTLYDKLTHQHYVKGIEYDPDTKRLVLPRGIDIKWLEYQLNAKANVDYNADPYDYMPEDVLLRYKPRNERQVKTLQFMVGAGEDYKYTKGHSQLCVNNNTGEGKTWACISTACYLGLKSIVITSRTGWLEQWKDRILEYTNITPREILFLTGSPSINHVLKYGTAQYKFILASHSTLASYAKTHGWEAIGELFRQMRVGLKFYDEAHMYFDNMAKLDFYTNTYKTYYVTATLARSNEDENRIFKYYIKNIPSISFFDENEDPHTSYTAYVYNSRPTAEQASKCKNAYGLDRNTYTNYVVKQDNFFLLLHILMCQVVIPAGGKVLIYIGTNAAIDYVKAWLEDHYPMFTYGVYTSVITNNKRAQLDKKVILSTTKSAGAAVDIAGLEKIIVLAEPFKSQVLARQTLGRTRADNTEYVEVVDNSFAQTRRFYNAKLPIFDKYATSCDEVRLNDNILRATAYQCIQDLEERPFPFVFL